MVRSQEEGSTERLEEIGRVMGGDAVRWVRETLKEEDCAACRVEDFTGKLGMSGSLFVLHTEHGRGRLKRARVIKCFLQGSWGVSQRLGLAREGLFYRELIRLREEAAQQAEASGSGTCGSDGNGGGRSEARGGHCLLAELLPEVDYAEGDLQTGWKLIITERLDGINPSYLFPLHHPATVGQDLEGAKLRAGPAWTEFEVCSRSFAMAARLHASFWMDRRLMLDRQRWGFLRGRGVYMSAEEEQELGSLNDSGEDPNWRAMMDSVLDCKRTLEERVWRVQEEREAVGEEHEYQRYPLVEHLEDLGMERIDAVRWRLHLRRCIEHSFGRIGSDGYAGYKREVQGSYPWWSLQHGDFFAGNCFLSRDTGGERGDEASAERFSLKLLDFEMIGVGSGPQELGQFMVSNPDAGSRRAMERKLVCDVYYGELVKNLQSEDASPSIPPVGAVWEEYKMGGACKWLWFAVYLGVQMKPAWAQFFVDQLSAFLEDHFPGEEGAAKLGMPRV